MATWSMCDVCGGDISTEEDHAETPEWLPKERSRYTGWVHGYCNLSKADYEMKWGPLGLTGEAYKAWLQKKWAGERGNAARKRHAEEKTTLLRDVLLRMKDGGRRRPRVTDARKIVKSLGYNQGLGYAETAAVLREVWPEQVAVIEGGENEPAAKSDDVQITLAEILRAQIETNLLLRKLNETLADFTAAWK